MVWLPAGPSVRETRIGIRSNSSQPAAFAVDQLVLPKDCACNWALNAHAWLAAAKDALAARARHARLSVRLERRYVCCILLSPLLTTLNREHPISGQRA